MPKGMNDPIYAGQLLGSTKSCIRNSAIAITETATPMVRETLACQLNEAIGLHEKIFNYMLHKGLYPAYDIEKVLANDIANAQMALQRPIKP